MSRPLMHKTNLRAVILEAATRAHPHWRPTQVSSELMDLIEYKVRTMIDKSLKLHSPNGKTVRDFH